MRIISGTHKGRFFYPPANLPVRPTTDFGKEALFNILNNRIDYETVSDLDLFSGTGILTYELSSRGCEQLVAVDQHMGCVNFIKKTIVEFGFKQVRVVKADVLKFIPQCKQQFDLILADPPYASTFIAQIPEQIFKANLLKPGGMLILEHPDTINLETAPLFAEHRKYSKVNFSIFQQPKTDTANPTDQNHQPDTTIGSSHEQ